MPSDFGDASKFKLMLKYFEMYLRKNIGDTSLKRFGAYIASEPFLLLISHIS